jgi:hypothetical protein
MADARPEWCRAVHDGADRREEGQDKRIETMEECILTMKLALERFRGAWIGAVLAAGALAALISWGLISITLR